MRTFTSVILAGLCLVLEAVPATAVEPGDYTGKAEYGGDLALSVRGNNASIEVTKPGCQGDTQSSLRQIGAGHWQMRPDFPGCVVDLRMEGDRINITEGRECFPLHGMQCTFDGFVAYQQKGAPAEEAAKVDVSDISSDTWLYGVDPVLGLSAHIRTSDGAVGIACIADGSNPATAEILALRATPELIAASGTIYMFEGRTDARAIALSPGKPYAEVRDTTCGVSLDAIRAAKSMYLIEGKIHSIGAVDGRTEIAIYQAGNQTIVSEGSDAAERLNGKAISLKGSSKALKALLRECRAARMDIESNCGL